MHPSLRGLQRRWLDRSLRGRLARALLGDQSPILKAMCPAAKFSLLAWRSEAGSARLYSMCPGSYCNQPDRRCQVIVRKPLSASITGSAWPLRKLQGVNAKAIVLLSNSLQRFGSNLALSLVAQSPLINNLDSLSDRQRCLDVPAINVDKTVPPHGDLEAHLRPNGF